MVRNLRQLGTTRNPITGARGNIFNLRSWLQGILGVLFLGIVIVLGLFLGRQVLTRLGVGDKIGAKRVF